MCYIEKMKFFYNLKYRKKVIAFVKLVLIHLA